MTDKSSGRRGSRGGRLGVKLFSGHAVTHEVIPVRHLLESAPLYPQTEFKAVCFAGPLPSMDMALSEVQPAPFALPDELLRATFSPPKEPLCVAFAQGSRTFNNRANLKSLRRSLQDQQVLMKEHQTVMLLQQERIDIMARKIAELEAKYQHTHLPPVVEEVPAAVHTPGSDPVSLTELVLRSSTWLSAQAVSVGAGMRNKNASSTPNKWKSGGAIFAINYRGHDYYPKFALGMDGKPLPIMKDILAVFSGHKVPLAIALWFVSANSWLDGTTPQDIVGTRPIEVLDAAKMEVAPIEHG